jgi:hypothetical protein
MTTIKYKGQPEIYLNTIVNDAASFFPDRVEPIDVEIVDAFFTYKNMDGEVVEENFLNGFFSYFEDKKYLNITTPKEKQLFEKYSSVFLTLRVMGKERKCHAIVKIDDKKEIMAHLRENSLKKKYDEKDEKSEDLYSYLNDSCIPMIGRPLIAYRQTVNGKEVSGISKKYVEKIDTAYKENIEAAKNLAIKNTGNTNSLETRTS